MSRACSTIDALRTATAAAHQALDHGIDPVAALRDRPRRIAMLRRYHAMHDGAETAMEPHLATDPALQFDRRRRAPALRADLAALGATASRPGSPLVIATRPAALGMLYVMEGSTLGGKLIRRNLHAAGIDMTGLHFLDPYQAETGRMWRIVLDYLEQVPQADLPALVDGAVSGFAYAATCLADPIDVPVPQMA